MGGPMSVTIKGAVEFNFGKPPEQLRAIIGSGGKESSFHQSEALIRTVFHRNFRKGHQSSPLTPFW
jgi:hypothetical protein